LKKFQFDGDKHDVVGVFVCMGNDELEIRQGRQERDKFTLKNVESTDASEGIVEGLDFRES
jgi:hypothetical protein